MLSEQDSVIAGVLSATKPIFLILKLTLPYTSYRILNSFVDVMKSYQSQGNIVCVMSHTIC